MATDRFATLVRFDSRANLVCLLPEVSSDKGWDSALLEPYLHVVLWLSAVFCTRLQVWPAPALAPAPAPAQVPAIVRKAWSVDARKDQTHAAHRPTGSKGGDTQRAFAGLLSSFDLLPCGSYCGSTLGTREHAVPHYYGSLPAR